ncbi:MAG: hypothetical protein R2940_02915 [Syntrophotaleaceae bacterium]
MEKSDVIRVTPNEAHRRIESGKAVLVCAYESDEKCQSMLLEGAETLHEFEDRLPEIPQEQEVIFYCA